MNDTLVATPGSPDFLAGGGKTGALMRVKDWAATPLGPTATWPQSLRTSVSLCLNCSFPLLIWWGPELVKIYNDAFAEIIADKHPHALGRPGHSVWPEIWHIIGPMLDRVMHQGEATSANDLQLVLNRRGHPEECYFSFSYSPMRDDSGRVGGVFCPVIETTRRVFAERHSTLLLDLESRLRDLNDPLSVKSTACELLGKFLNVAQLGYCEATCDGEHVVIEGDWNDWQVPSMSGIHRLDNYGPIMIADLRQGTSVLMADVAADPLVCSPAFAKDFNIMSIRSFMAVPLLKSGRLVAHVFAASATARRWTRHEDALLRDVSERIWSTVERTRAQQDRERLVAIVENSSDFILHADLQGKPAFLNRKGRQLVGLDEHSDIRRTTITDFFVPEQRKFVAGVVIPAAQRDGRWVGELTFQHFMTGASIDVLYDIFRLDDPDTGKPINFATITRDISEWKTAGRALADSEARLRLAQKIGRIGSFDWDLATNQATYSEEYVAIHGLPPGTVTESYESWIGRVHPGDRDRVLAFTTRIEKATPTEIEYRIIHPGDGAVRCISERREVFFDDQGCATRVIGSQQDVTVQRGVDTALRMATETAAASAHDARITAERVHLALEAGAIVGTWIWDLLIDRFTADERFALSFGLDPEVCRTGLGIEQVLESVHPDDIERLREAIAEAIERGGAYACQYRVQHRDGVYRWIEANGRVDKAADGTALRFPGVLLDIDSRHQMEAERDRAVTLLRSFVETVPGVVYAKDREGRILIASAGTAALIGKKPDEFLGRTDADVLDDKAQAAAVMANDRRIMDDGFAEQLEELVNLPDGTPVTWLSTKAPFRNNAGEVIGLIGMSMDITARKQAEAILLRGREELEALVTERTRDLKATQARLAHAQRMEALGNLAGGIAHDFNNVVQAVQGGARLIERRPADIDRVLSLAKMITESAARGAAITRRLLAFSHRGDLHAEPIDAASLLNGIHEILSHTLGVGLTVRVETEPGLPPLLADKGQLETVLVNLATNARDAMQGSGVLTYFAGYEVILNTFSPGHSSTLKPGKYIRLWVSDNGRGMTPEVMAKACEPFFTTKGVGQGTGLGLAMSRGFAQQSGGALHIESELGRGTVVKLWFPVAGTELLPESISSGTEAVNVVSPGLRGRVLMVDDEQFVRETLGEEMQDAGFDVLSAASGADALAMLVAGEMVDLIVVDLSMPDMDGLTLVQEVWRQLPGLPAILLTGFATSAVESAISSAMSSSFILLRKPIDGRLLAERAALMLKRAAQGSIN